jgi:hypothetical protein
MDCLCTPPQNRLARRRTFAVTWKVENREFSEQPTRRWRSSGWSDKFKNDVFVQLTLVPMTGDQSRLLKIGGRVRWGTTTTDLGTVVEASWSGVTVDWDDDHTTSIQHNDMAQVERVPLKM